jgi:hypothetical protein
MPDGMVERMSPRAKDQVELSNFLFEIGWEDKDRPLCFIGRSLQKQQNP